MKTKTRCFVQTLLMLCEIKCQTQHKTILRKQCPIMVPLSNIEAWSNNIKKPVTKLCYIKPGVVHRLFVGLLKLQLNKPSLHQLWLFINMCNVSTNTDDVFLLWWHFISSIIVCLQVVIRLWWWHLHHFTSAQNVPLMSLTHRCLHCSLQTSTVLQAL